MASLLFYWFFNKIGDMEVFQLYLNFLNVFLETSWIWSPFIFAILFFQSWMYYSQRLYWCKLDWILLEVKPPKEIESSPLNMEQIFAGLWGSFGTVGNKYEKYIKGMIQDYFSFEIVGLNGEIHFYLRALKKYRNLVEAQVYSQYPQAEIKEVEDYAYKLPGDVPGRNWNLWGSRLVLSNKEAFPIRTYPYLIDEVKTDQPFFDPLAGLMEVLGKLQLGEQIWMQILFRPEADVKRNELVKEAYKILGKKVASPAEGVIIADIKGWIDAIFETISTFISGEAPVEKVKDKTADMPSLAQFLSPGEKDMIKMIEEKASKKVYESKIQFAYIARKELFTMAYVSAMFGIFSQFANLNMNALKPDKATMTKASYLFAKVRKAYKQRVLLRMLRTRSFWEKGYVFNIEELATLFHFPTIAVKGPMTPYIGSKKGGAPMDLPSL